MRLYGLLVMAATLSLSTGLIAADKEAFLTAEDGGPDFAVQGEYAGKVGGQSWGVQVIALGDGKFDAVVYPGGLPGAGWAQPTKHKLTGAASDGKTSLKGDAGEASITDGTLTLKLGANSGDLARADRKSPTLGQKPPAGAKILFDGTNTDAWQNGQMSDDKLLMVGTRTNDKFADFTLHLEFRTPFMPKSRGQARGNSGMYLGDQYECQVLDSFGLEGLDNECGGIYQNARPSVNMCLPPLSWQTYDVEFTAAKFDSAGKVVAPARTTIRHNGVRIHDNIELKSTPGGGQNDQKPGALFLQNHGDPVRFRNIWLVEKR